MPSSENERAQAWITLSRGWGHRPHVCSVSLFFRSRNRFLHVNESARTSEGPRNLTGKGQTWGLRAPLRGLEEGSMHGFAVLPQGVWYLFLMHFLKFYLVPKLFISIAHISSFSKPLKRETVSFLEFLREFSAPHFELKLSLAKHRGCQWAW